MSRQNIKVKNGKRRGLIICTLLVIILLVTSCSDDDDPAVNIPPILSVTPIDISGPYFPSDSSYGDMKFIFPVLTPFGLQLEQFQYSPGFEYFTKIDAPVRVVTRGIIEAIVANPQLEGDWEVHVTSLPGANYTIIYDHVLNVNFLEGTPVEAGETLGTAGFWNDDMGRTVLQVNLYSDNQTRALCPLEFGDSTFLAQHKQLLSEYNARFPNATYDTLCLTGPIIP